jgi:hypothetical protein
MILWRCVFSISGVGDSSLVIADLIGRVTPRWAWSFWELIGLKKALEVTEGTWLLPVELCGRPTAEPAVLRAALARLPDSALRNG